jgi:23S rRNA pseudouridine1911/1915/1917 synthase
VSGDDLDADDHRVIVTDEQVGERIDAVLAAAIATLSRAVVQRLIDDQHVTLNALPVKKPGQRVKLGDVIDVDIPAPEPIELVPEDIPLAIRRAQRVIGLDVSTMVLATTVCSR